MVRSARLLFTYLSRVSPRDRLLAWYRGGLRAVDAETLVYDHLVESGPHPGRITVLAVGKAAAGMCRGAARALGAVSGICVSNQPDLVPDGVELLIGDHPIVGPRSIEAGRRILELAAQTSGPCIVLVSGGGSALCEFPLDGVAPEFITGVTAELVSSGAPIDEVNLIRTHLSAIKGGGLAHVIGGDFETLVISDVAGHGPELVASGPTIPSDHQPDRALDLLRAHGHVVPVSVEDAVRRTRPAIRESKVAVIGDGMTAARAMSQAAMEDGCQAMVDQDWIWGPVEDVLDRLLSIDFEGLLVAAGEPVMAVHGDGVGGRNTHASLLAAIRIAHTPLIFAAMATDGSDGNSGAAGAVVDGTTLMRGGDPHQALERCDSAGYLRNTGDLVITGDTGTNVADLWALWRP